MDAALDASREEAAPSDARPASEDSQAIEDIALDAPIPVDGAVSLDAATPDVAADVDAGCPALDPVDESPLPVESLGNLTESTKKDGYDDDYVYNKAGDKKLGLRRNWGGAIVFFGKHTGTVGMNTTNAVDGADTGREVQIALYDPDRRYQGCAYDASCATTKTACPETMAYLGWNPVQGGNRCNMGSGTSGVTLGKGEITSKTVPLQWNPNWDRSDCTLSCSSPSTDRRASDVELEQRVRFVRPNVVELDYSVKNVGAASHRATAHEFPTLYAAFGRSGTPDLQRLFDSSGKEITSGWTTDSNGFRYQNFESSGGWASLQNAAADYGVALFYESGMGQFQAWNKLANPSKFNNFRGLFTFGVGAGAVVKARSYLILGGLAEVTSETKWLDAHLPPFGWVDGPAPDAKVSGTITVHGWALDNKSVASVHARVDGGPLIKLSYGVGRPDVCAVWPGHAACATAKVGFQGTIDVSASPTKTCGQVLEVIATDGDGNTKVIGRRRLSKA